MRVTHLRRDPTGRPRVLPPTPPINLVPMGVEDVQATADTGAGLHDPKLSLRDELAFLLHCAAEVEHALLIEYLYAAYSLREDYQGADKPPGLKDWRTNLLQIAREEMAHLLTVQNLLRLIGAPLNFEREDFPFRGDIYPLRMSLGPLTKGSLAKYVHAEMPANHDPNDPVLKEVKERAKTANGGEPINHVGWLYDRIHVLFQALPVKQLRLDSVPYWARKEDWGIGDPRLLILPDSPADPANPNPAEVKQKAVEAVRKVAEQGEGYDPAVGQASHFDLFLAIYKAFHFRENDPNEPFPKWMVPVASNPTTLPGPAAEGRTPMNDPRTRAWAQLLNLRYRMLLNYLSHFLLLDQPLGPAGGRTGRWYLNQWVFEEMRLALKQVALKVGGLSTAASPAGPPFELPYTLQLPDRDGDRWRTHLDVIDAAEFLITRDLQKRPEDKDDPLLKQVLQMDAARRPVAEAAADGNPVPQPGGNGPPPATPEEKMIEVLKSKRPIAQVFHNNIDAGGVTLSSLFAAENYAEILQFLRTGTAIRPPASPKKLVVPGDPAASGLVVQIKTGVMKNRFTPDEIAVVEEWITSLGSPSLSPEAKMLALLKHKRDNSPASVIHFGIMVPGGNLSQLFAQEKYAEILQFLRTGTAVRAPATGMKLVVPGDPASSGFLKQLTEGVMQNQFTPEEIEVVKEWIVSLAGT